MSSSATLDGKNRNPILVNLSKNKDQESLRQTLEMDVDMEDEIDSYESN